MATYTVESGDNLSAIADRFGTTVDAICALNGIDNPNLIFAGQVLTLPEGGGGGGGGSNGPVFDIGQFSIERDAFIGFDALMPFIQQCANHYGTDARTMAAMVQQESSYTNHIVHDDGTGHGLIGLDDNGLLSSFEQFTGEFFGRGAQARSIPPEWQMEYLAKTLSEFTNSFGSVDMAARVWHTGPGGRNSPAAVNYSNLIAGHKHTLFGA